MLTANSLNWAKKYSLTSKWNLIFDKSPEWISFKPQLGQKVYPCYSCKNMFSTKATFQDHINRRVIIIKFRCSSCANTLTFYNRCSFLLHARKHYSLLEGSVNLSCVGILPLPVELAGFSRDHSVPFLYDEDEEFVDGSVAINSQFYHPDESEAGKRIITLKPFNLVFHYIQDDTNIVMVLKQITSNIPLCEFIKKEKKMPSRHKQLPKLIPLIENIKEEPLEEQETTGEFALPVISKVETLSPPQPVSCPECKETQLNLASHFAGNDKPTDASLLCRVCKYIAATPCSLKAHVRIHEIQPPFVCPECGDVFAEPTPLERHMEDVCFHLCKQVRFRCPAQKCVKHFVLPKKYTNHLGTHFQRFNKCSACALSNLSDTEFIQHALSHEKCAAVKTFRCGVCLAEFGQDGFSEHIALHTNDRKQFVYTYLCKYCRGCFRWRTSYDAHSSRCTKTESFLSSSVVTVCTFCKQKIKFKDKGVQKTCAICKQVNPYPTAPARSVKSEVCKLCKEDISGENREVHTKLCRYNNPVVPIRAIRGSADKESSDSGEKNETSAESLKSESPVIAASGKKKRKRPVASSSASSSTVKSKKVNAEESSDLQADEPVSFDGTYYCKLCGFTSKDRGEFHSHIVAHRDVSTSYQCMECGECFVVKPSLIKHLLHYHKIADTAAYLAKNECCDKSAIKELQTQLKLGAAEHKGPVKENQCTVCLQEFGDKLALNKHFRMHGMAFLMKNK